MRTLLGILQGGKYVIPYIIQHTLQKYLQKCFDSSGVTILVHTDTIEQELKSLTF